MEVSIFFREKHFDIENIPIFAANNHSTEY